MLKMGANLTQSFCRKKKKILEKLKDTSSICTKPKTELFDEYKPREDEAYIVLGWISSKQENKSGDFKRACHAYLTQKSHKKA